MKKDSPTRCSIIGDKIDENEAPDWNCALESFPIENQHDEYEKVQKFFDVKFIEKAIIDQKQLPDRLELNENEETEITIEIDNQVCRY